jgi:phosphomannomutase
MLASCRLAEYLSHHDRRFRSYTVRYRRHIPPIPSNWPARMLKNSISSGEIGGHFSKQYELLDIDGARIVFNGGWALVRASNTSPNLTLRFEADSEERLQEIQSIIYDKLREFPSVILP